MDPALNKSSDLEMSATTREIQDYAKELHDEEKELQKSDDLEIQRSSNPEILKSRDRNIPRFNAYRVSMDPAI